MNELMGNVVTHGRYCYVWMCRIDHINKWYALSLFFYVCIVQVTIIYASWSTYSYNWIKYCTMRSKVCENINDTAAKYNVSPMIVLGPISCTTTISNTITAKILFVVYVNKQLPGVDERDEQPIFSWAYTWYWHIVNCLFDKPREYFCNVVEISQQ